VNDSKGEASPAFKRERGQKATPVRPEKAEDREYLKMMYEEQAEHARLHEELRGAATSLFMALIAGLLAFAVTEGAEPRREWVAGATIIVVSLVGFSITYKHYERYKMHLSRLRGFRSSLELSITLSLRSINPEWTTYHEEQHRFSHKWPTLHAQWLFIYFVTGVVGCILLWMGTHPAVKAAENCVSQLRY
jgi:hypothetical protein